VRESGAYPASAGRPRKDEARLTAHRGQRKLPSRSACPDGLRNDVSIWMQEVKFLKRLCDLQKSIGSSI